MEPMSYHYPPPGLGRPSPPVSDPKMDIINREFEAMKEAEQRRHRFVETLMEHIKSLSAEKDDAIRQLQRSEFTINAYQDSLTLTSKKIDELQKSMDCDRFVLAVVDGDNALFEDEFIKDGAAGGERAAHKLQQAIFDYLKDKPFFQHDFKIIIRVFVNLQGLLRPYGENKIIPNPGTLQQFVQGFNKTHELAEIVDAGNLKEAADSKVKATLSLYRRNLHCKHILLAASGDNSYAGFLRQFIVADKASQPLTLIESLPFAKDLAQLTTYFQTTKFERVFRDAKIVIEPRAPYNGVTAKEPLSEAPVNVWATAKPISLPVRTTKSPETKPVTSVKPSRKEILVNIHGERVDSFIKHDVKIYGDLKKRKMCNRYWLLDDCEHSNCSHDHSGTISAAELNQLRLIARTISCREGLSCKDPYCIDGHRCVQGERCAYGDKCHFDEDMHYVTMEGLKSIPVPAEVGNGFIHVR